MIPKEQIQSTGNSAVGGGETGKKEKDPRWPKQLGDFGEQLVIYVMGRHKGMKLALVDHAGADVIASDLNNSDKRYAISVKSRAFGKSESKLYHFDQHNVDELRDFAKSFQLKPAVAIVCEHPTFSEEDVAVAENNKFKVTAKYYREHVNVVIDVFIFLLDDAFAMLNEKKPYFSSRSGDGFNFKFENRYYEQLTKEEPRIDHTQLTFDVLGATHKWDS